MIDKMYYTDTGNGFPILLGHSYLFDGNMWTSQVKFLSERYRVIVPDLWGHGDSPELPSNIHTIKDIAQAHLCLMDELGIREFAIVGLSVGGMWAAELAVMAPERIRALILMDSYIGSETPEEQQKYKSMLNAVEAAGAITSPLLEYIVSQFYSSSALASDIEQLNQYLTSITDSRLRESIVPIGRMIFDRPDRMEILDHIRCPVLIAHGEYDQPRPPAEGIKMAERLKCDFSLIPHAGHISNRENPAYVNFMVDDFMAWNLPGQ